MEKTRILIPYDDDDTKSIADGLHLLLERIEDRNNNIHNAAIYIPQLGNIQNTSLAEVLGDKIANELLKNSSIKVTPGANLSLVTKRTIQSHHNLDALLVIYAYEDMLDEADSHKNVSTIIAVPSLPDSADQWEKTWHPTILGKSTTEEMPLIADIIIEIALSALTRRINLGHSALHPRDEDATKGLLRILRKNDHHADCKDIRAWAIRNGWAPKCADYLEKQANKILNSKNKPRSVGQAWNPKIYDAWQEEAKS